MTRPVWTFTAIAREHMARRQLVAHDLLGSIPAMLSEADAAGAVEQIDRAYKDAGGGWRDRSGLTLASAGTALRYPGDPPRQLIASAKLRDETILFFNGAWIAVVQPDGSYGVACID